MQQRAISYFADMVAGPLLAGALAIFALTHITKPALVEWCLLVMIGAALWTVTEYFMHRVIYHRIPIFEKYHEAHHTDPRTYVGAPPMVGTSVVFVVSFVPLATFSPVLANAVSLECSWAPST